MTAIIASTTRGCHENAACKARNAEEHYTVMNYRHYRTQSQSGICVQLESKVAVTGYQYEFTKNKIYIN